MSTRLKRWQRVSRTVVLAACVLVAGVAGLAGAAAAQEFSFLEPFGFADARLMGMGYSHVAIWDVPNPLYSNPASFGLGQDRLVLTFGSGWADEAVSDNFKFVAVSDVERGAGAGGFAWGQYRWYEGDDQFSGNTLNYMVGKSFAGWGALGVGVRYLRGGGIGDPAVVPIWHGIAADAGLVLKHDVLAVGVIARDATVTRLAFDDGTTRAIAPTYSCGLSLRPGPGAVFAIDAHGISKDGSRQEIFSGGFEGWLTPHFALRAGVILGDGADREARAYTGGIGILFGDFEMGYALVTDAESVKKQCITLTRRF